jgi:hypothetical protein
MFVYNKGATEIKRLKTFILYDLKFEFLDYLLSLSNLFIADVSRSDAVKTPMHFKAKLFALVLVDVGRLDDRRVRRKSDGYRLQKKHIQN